MIFKLDEEDVLILSAMLQTVSGMAVDNLKYINPRPYKRDDPDITALRKMVVTYMALRERLLEQLVAYQHGKMATATENARKAGLEAVVNTWNTHIKRINGAFLQDLIDADYIPVIASIAIGNDGGYCNVNADVMAGQIAAATGAAKILFLTDVDGLYLDFDDKDTLVSQLSLEEARDLIDSGTLSSGMIPKLRSCVAALEGGVPSAYIVNGTIPHAILLEMLTLSGVGTAVYADSEDATNASRGPIGNFASKLLENK